MKIIFKIIIAVFMLLNIVVLVAGSFVMNDMVIQKKSLESQLLVNKNKEDDAYEKLNILKQSREETFLKLSTLKEDIDYLDTTVQGHMQDKSFSLSQKAQLEQSITNYQKQNNQLEKKISRTKQKILDAQRVTIKARTRSS